MRSRDIETPVRDAVDQHSEPVRVLETPSDDGLDPQQVQSQRLDALAQMAGHVAHEYNNLLTTILGFSGLMRRSNHLSADERDNLRHIDDAAHRAAELTQHLLSFARGGLVSYGPVDLVQVATEAVSLAEPTMGANLRLVLHAPQAPQFIDGDADQVQQALLNVMFNARDAMTGNGELHITVQPLGGEVEIAVRDTGPGMDEETRQRAFEPFFSRKAHGGRGGLGLSTTYGIVKGHHGRIAVESEPGKGTTVIMAFPASAGPQGAIRSGDGDLALIVRADNVTRDRASRLATSLGLTPIFANDAAHAIDLVAARPQRFATAIGTGKFEGLDDLRAILQIHPTLPLLLCASAEL